MLKNKMAKSNTRLSAKEKIIPDNLIFDGTKFYFIPTISSLSSLILFNLNTFREHK